MRSDPVAERARQYYTDLPYHNWTHARTVRETALDLVERCGAHRIPVDRQVVDAAALFHDAGYPTDTPGSDEGYSAAIAARELHDLGYDDAFIGQVTDCIMATRPDGAFETVEEKVVRAADLRSFMADYGTFTENAARLREELAQREDRTYTDEEWVEHVTETATFYLDQEIKLTPAWPEFHTQAWENVERYREEHG